MQRTGTFRQTDRELEAHVRECKDAVKRIVREKIGGK
jgi:hypothetical protein